MGKDLKPFFDQYLRTVQIPTLEYYYDDSKIVYRWVNVVEDFNMPIRIFVEGHEKWIYPKTGWTNQYMDLEKGKIEVDPNFYVGVLYHSDISRSEKKE